jgi:hypothetical protein
MESRRKGRVSTPKRVFDAGRLKAIEAPRLLTFTLGHVKLKRWAGRFDTFSSDRTFTIRRVRA